MLAGATAQVRELAERADIPIAMTLLGIGGVPARHPLNMGMMGMHGESWVNAAIQEADLLLALGMRFDDRVTGNVRTYAPNARKIHIDIDPAEFHKNVRVDVALAGDLSAVLDDLGPLVETGDRSAWRAAIAGMKGDVARPRHPEPARQRAPLRRARHQRHLADDEREGHRRDRRRPAPDVGGAVLPPRRAAHADHLGRARDDGLRAAGRGRRASLARPDAEVWVVAGDGGFQMTMAELATIAQEKIKINVAVINNGYLGMVRQWQEFFYERRYAATPLLSPDFAKLAECFGLRGETVRTRAAVEPAVERARNDERTVVIDFQVEQEDTVYPMVPAGADLHDMIRRPSPAPIVETARDA